MTKCFQNVQDVKNNNNVFGIDISLKTDFLKIQDLSVGENKPLHSYRCEYIICVCIFLY